VRTSDCPRLSTRPELVCACRPSRPSKLIYDFPPDVVLIDMTGHEPLPWLPQVAAVVSKNNLPAVAWANNFLAPEIDALRDAGWLIFRWSPQPGPGSTDERQALRAYLTTDWHAGIIPLIIASPAGSPGELMASAADVLFRLRSEESRPITRDAVTLLNLTLRALTRLAVPLARYEEESKYFWGLYPIRELLAGAERFVSATRIVGLPGEAEKALDLLKATYDLYREKDPPLWTALSRILTELDDSERLVICPNASLCRLFSETLAGYLGLSAEELRELGITFSWPKNLRSRTHGTCVPLIVGAPGSYDWSRLSPLCGAERIEVLVYPHEFRLLRYSVREMSARAVIDVNENLASLASLVNKEPPHIEREVSQAMVLAAPKLIALDGQDAVETQVDQYRLLPDLDSAAEWEALLPRDCSEEMADLGVLDADGSAITDRAIRITFDGGDVIYFERDDIVQAVVNGALEERTAASVSPGDQLLVIDGQRRQSLYSLILGRLHDHPAVRIHLNLMERWWEEIEAAYIRKWHGFGKSDWSLLQEIQNRGSRITTVQTIQNWVRCIHCPEDSEDMRRMAEALDMAFSKASYRLIHKAAQRVHVLHRNISRRLNTWLQQHLEGYGNADEVLDGIVDDDLQLTLRDFQDSVVLLGVRTVEAVGDPILRSRLGVLLRGDQR